MHRMQYPVPLLGDNYGVAALQGLIKQCFHWLGRSRDCRAPQAAAAYYAGQMKRVGTMVIPAAPRYGDRGLHGCFRRNTETREIILDVVNTRARITSGMSIIFPVKWCIY